MRLKIIGFTLLVLTLTAIFLVVKNKKQESLSSPAQNPPEVIQISENEKPQIVSTTPDPLDGAIVPSNQQIEITFNRPLENEGEFKLRIEPEIKYKLTLSNERKTAEIAPQEPFELGHEYTIYITSDTKFTGYGDWGEEKTFRFRTVKYRGI